MSRSLAYIDHRLRSGRDALPRECCWGHRLCVVRRPLLPALFLLLDNDRRDHRAAGPSCEAVLVLQRDVERDVPDELGVADQDVHVVPREDERPGLVVERRRRLLEECYGIDDVPRVQLVPYPHPRELALLDVGVCGEEVHHGLGQGLLEHGEGGEQRHRLPFDDGIALEPVEEDRLDDFCVAGDLGRCFAEGDVGVPVGKQGFLRCFERFEEALAFSFVLFVCEKYVVNWKRGVEFYLQISSTFTDERFQKLLDNILLVLGWRGCLVSVSLSVCM